MQKDGYKDTEASEQERLFSDYDQEAAEEALAILRMLEVFADANSGNKFILSKALGHALIVGDIAADRLICPALGIPSDQNDFYLVKRMALMSYALAKGHAMSGWTDLGTLLISAGRSLK